MGNAAAVGQPQRNDNRGPQEDGLSFKGKVGGLKIIMHSDQSKAALLKYLTEKKMDCVLELYFELDELVLRGKAQFLAHLHLLRAKYNALDKTQLNTTQLQVCSFVEELFSVDEEDKGNTDEYLKNFKTAEDRIYIILSKLLDDFMNSTYYHEFDKLQNDKKNMKTKTKAKALDKSITPTNTPLISYYNNILIVDDIPAKSHELSAVFEGLGHRPRQANHGRVAQNITRFTKFSAIFINLGIKSIDAIALARSIKQWENETTAVSESEKLVSPLNIRKNSLRQNSFTAHSSNHASHAAAAAAAAADARAEPVNSRHGSFHHSRQQSISKMRTGPVLLIGLTAPGKPSPYKISNDEFDGFLPLNFTPEQLYEALQSHYDSLPPVLTEDDEGESEVDSIVTAGINPASSAKYIVTPSAKGANVSTKAPTSPDPHPAQAEPDTRSPELVVTKEGVKSNA